MTLGNGTWVAEGMRDTRYYIFKKLFNCRISNIQSMSVDYLQHFGMPVSGHPEYDKEISHELIERLLPISEMVKYFNDGVTVEVVNYSDTKVIYEYITDHLNFWKNRIEDSFNARGAPIDDLIVMDRFAMSVYKHAVHQFTIEVVESILARRMSSVMRLSIDNIMGGGPKPLVVNANGEVEQEKIPERISMAEAFVRKQGILTGKRSWN